MFFMDTMDGFDAARHPGCVIHILCVEGQISFTFQDTHYNLAVGDYAILTDPLLVSDFTASADCCTIIMGLSSSFVAAVGTRSNYGIIGQLSLFQNPVMKLTASEFDTCRADMERLRQRLAAPNHLYHEELIGHLLMAHILDLYDIHARAKAFTVVSERISSLVRRFIELLYQGEYIRHRDLPHYASLLCITPHYLTEICKKASGRTASYWIDRFAVQEITRLLCQKELTLTDIAERMNFSSVSYFSRYVQKHIGVYPTVFRDNLIKRDI